MLLTTQYLEEADALAGQITMLAAGRVVARGTPDELKARVGGDWLEITPADPAEWPRFREIAARVGEPVDRGGVLAVPVSDRTRALVTVSAALADAGLVPLDLSVRRPTLDEAFLQLTGTAITPPAPATAGPTVDEVSR